MHLHRSVQGRLCFRHEQFVLTHPVLQQQYTVWNSIQDQLVDVMLMNENDKSHKPTQLSKFIYEKFIIRNYALSHYIMIVVAPYRTEYVVLLLDNIFPTTDS